MPNIINTTIILYILNFASTRSVIRLHPSTSHYLSKSISCCGNIIMTPEQRTANSMHVHLCTPSWVILLPMHAPSIRPGIRLNNDKVHAHSKRRCYQYVIFKSCIDVLNAGKNLVKISHKQCHHYTGFWPSLTIMLLMDVSVLLVVLFFK